jgi:disulfide bond formation protein DsbB
MTELPLLPIDERRLAHEKWAHAIDVLDNILLRALDASRAFAKIALQTTFLLNGGAIVALPTFLQLAGVKFSDHRDVALIAIGLFVIGLILSGIANAIALAGSVAAVTQISQMTVIARFERAQRDDPTNKAGKWQQLAADAAKKRDKKARLSLFLRWTAVGLVITAFLCFVAGILVGAAILSGVQ